MLGLGCPCDASIDALPPLLLQLAIRRKWSGTSRRAFNQHFAFRPYGDDDGDNDDDDSDKDDDDGEDDDDDDSDCDDEYSCLVLDLATLPAALPFFKISPNMEGPISKSSTQQYQFSRLEECKVEMCSYTDLQSFIFCN